MSRRLMYSLDRVYKQAFVFQRDFFEYVHKLLKADFLV